MWHVIDTARALWTVAVDTGRFMLRSLLAWGLALTPFVVLMYIAFGPLATVLSLTLLLACFAEAYFTS